MSASEKPAEILIGREEEESGSRSRQAHDCQPGGNLQCGGECAPMTTVKARYEKLAAYREPYLRRAQTCASLTLPYLYHRPAPPQHELRRPIRA
jgi:hypothetical protein